MSDQETKLQKIPPVGKGLVSSDEEKMQMKQVIDAQAELLAKQRQQLAVLKKITERQKAQIERLSRPIANLEEEFIVGREDVHFNDIGGLDRVLGYVRRFEWGILYPGMYEAYAMKPPKGLMLYGPPGCGKTMVAKAISNEISACFIELPTTRFMSKYVGEAEANLEKMLVRCNEIARERATKVVVFLDEAEQAFRKRGSTHGHNVNDRVVNVFLRYLDGFGESEGLIFVAATNKLELVDEAVLRSGRFDYKVEVPRPDRRGVEDILRKQVAYRHRQAKWEIYQIDDYGRLADMLYAKGATGADVAAVLSMPADSLIDCFARMPAEEDVGITLVHIYAADIEAAIKAHEFGERSSAKVIVGFGR
jgi:SpoVK/Ycf46/Vps4 family AAA+-type ATPase